MMWQQIRSNQIRSAVLTASMGILLLVIGYFLGLTFLDNAIAGLVIALAIWIIMSLVAYFQGDGIFLALSRARKIGKQDNPRLYNIVEEMTIASGLEKVPDIYIIDDQALNAFATGRDPKKAAVAVTSGLLQKLNRDELQGVIAHEISHVVNRDVLLMVMCGVLLGSIVILAWVGTRMLFFTGMAGGRRSSRSGGGGGGMAQVIILVVALVLMILAPIAAQLIYFAISRKREYLADASAALYTRYPEGLASALEKLAASTKPLQTANQATAPMYIMNPFRKEGMAASNLSSTHPPISERIRILRSMAGASFTDYNEAYGEMHRGSGVIPASSVKVAGAVGLRGAMPEAEGAEPEPGRVGRTRETSDMMWRLSNYKTIDCDCGDKLKIPPNFKGSSVRCPHCGRIHPVK